MGNYEAQGHIGMRMPDKLFSQPPDALVDGFLATSDQVQFAIDTYVAVSEMLQTCEIPGETFDEYLMRLARLGRDGYKSAVKSVLNMTVLDIRRIDVFGSKCINDYEHVGDDLPDEQYNQDLELTENVAHMYEQFVDALSELKEPYAREQLDFVTHVFLGGGANGFERQNSFLFLQNRTNLKANALPDTES